ncbi:MAG: DNA polymerase III subunit chi [Proteobacteria bacterium]|nr:DNA polymerase III subunit chi [Pseudomonadota bacterium]
MNQIDFYILADDSTKNIDVVCCQLCEKALKNSMNVIIYTQSFEQAEKIDSLLWNFKADSFIPHKNLLNQEDNDNTSSKLLNNIDFDYPVLITDQINSQQSNTDLLINLNTSPPPLHQQFKRIAELVDKNPQAKEVARNSYRLYQQKNCKLNKYDL